MASNLHALAPGTRVLVTGASGFIGAHLLGRLVESGCRVVALARPISDLWRIEPLLDRAELVRSELDGVEPADVGPVDVVFHLAAAGVQASQADPAGIVEVNVNGTLRMLRLADVLGAKRFVYCGSCFEYGGGSGLREDRLPAPLSEYGASKAAGWMLAHAYSRRHDLPVASVRPFTVYGPLEGGLRLVPHVVRTALAGEPIELTGGEQRRDFVYVDDAVDGLMRAAAAPGAAGGTFNLATGSPVSVKEVVATVLEVTGSASEPLFGARPYRDSEVPTLSGDTSAAREELGWTARTSLRAGIEATVEWQRGRRLRELAVSRA